jgi:hypothetical protein
MFETRSNDFIKGIEITINCKPHEIETDNYNFMVPTIKTSQSILNNSDSQALSTNAS